MLYKELRAARRKYLPVFIIFILVGLIDLTLFNPNTHFTDNTTFHTWITWLIFLSIGASVMGGADSIAEETGRSTISFLLTRPVSRATIYTVKFLVGAVFLSIILIGTSLAMFLFEQLPQTSSFNVWAPDLNSYTLRSITLVKMETGKAFVAVAVILALGWVILALTTLISIFARSAIQTIVIAIVVALALIAVYAAINAYFVTSYSLGRFFDIYGGFGLGDVLLLLAIAAGIYFAGLKIFKAKEF